MICCCWFCKSLNFAFACGSVILRIKLWISWTSLQKSDVHIFFFDITGGASKPPTSYQTSAHNSAQGTPHLSPKLTSSGSGRASPRRSMSLTDNSHRISLPSSKPTSQSTTAPNSPPSHGSAPCKLFSCPVCIYFRKYVKKCIAIVVLYPTEILSSYFHSDTLSSWSIGL